jgi:hypothetical protein
MAESVRWLCEQDPVDEWIDVPNTAPKWILRSNQLPTMKWWGLVERKAVEPPSEQQAKKKGDNKHSGLWRPTQKGRDFVFGGLAIPKYVYTYYDTVTRFGDELTTFGECNDTFSYIAVMSNGKLPSDPNDEKEC